MVDKVALEQGFPHSSFHRGFTLIYIIIQETDRPVDGPQFRETFSPYRQEQPLL
jgi:hypothetical protein